MPRMGSWQCDSRLEKESLSVKKVESFGENMRKDWN